MDYYIAYQQPDTLKSESLPALHLKSAQPSVLNVERAVIPVENLIIDITPRRKPEPQATQIPVSARARMDQIQEEEILFADSSKFVKPQAKVSIEIKPLVAGNEIELPEHTLNQPGHDWITIILSLCLIILATIRMPYARYIGHMFQSLVNYTTSVRMFRERNYSLVHGAYRLDIYFYLTSSLFVFQALKYFEIPLPFKNFILYLFCLLAVIGYFLIKRMLYSLAGFVNNGLAETNEYWFNLANYNRALGLFLFPVVAILAFSPFFKPAFLIFSGLIITAVFYGIALQRGIIILLKKQFSIFYLFLYLCTLEILPLLLIYKMVFV